MAEWILCSTEGGRVAGGCCMGWDVAGAGGLNCDSVCMLVFLCGVVVVMSCLFPHKFLYITRMHKHSIF